MSTKSKAVTALALAMSMLVASSHDWYDSAPGVGDSVLGCVGCFIVYWLVIAAVTYAETKPKPTSTTKAVVIVPTPRILTPHERRRRMRELHPDYMRREQTTAEREEYTRLANAI